MSSAPFEYFDPATAAKGHTAKVEIEQKAVVVNPYLPKESSQAPTVPVSAPHHASPAEKNPIYPPQASGMAYPPAKPTSHHGGPQVPSSHGVAQPKPSYFPPPSQGPVPSNHGLIPSARGPGHGQNPPPGGKSGHNPYAAQQAQAGHPPGPYALPHHGASSASPQGGYPGYQPSIIKAPQPQQPHLQPSSQRGPQPAKSGTPPVMPHPTGPELTLSTHQNQQFLDYGFVIVPNVVSSELRNKALQVINKSIGKTGNLNRATTSCPELVQTPAIMNLFYASGAHSITSQLLGTGFHPPNLSFINLQYPGDVCIEEPHSVPDERRQGPEALQEHELKPIPNWTSYWKLDGLPAPAAGPDDERHLVRNYSLLLAVFLNEVDHSNLGNITLWPGSHLGIQSVLRSNGGAAASLKAGKLDRPVIQNLHLDNVIPQQLSAKAGDVLLCHYQVAHTHAPNLGADIRYVVYFRVYSKFHTPGTFRPESMDNVFIDFEGLYELIGKNHPK